MRKDRRFWAANGRVAHESLVGQVDVPLSAGVERRVRWARCSLCAIDEGLADDEMDLAARRDKELLFGQAFQALDDRGAWSFGFDPEDGYAGYVRTAALAPPGQRAEPSHRVAALVGHLYRGPDLKSGELMALSYGSRLSLSGETHGLWCRLASGGWVSAKQIAPLGDPAPDWVAEAQRFLGVGYLWGGNSHQGVDCSGLVQLALQAAGRACPRDSDLQEAAFREASGPRQRGDLVFWKGHVGILLGEDTLLHANAHHMAVAQEPLSGALARIGGQEFGAVRKYARPGP